MTITRRRALLRLGVLALVLAAGVALAMGRGNGSPLDDARALLADDAGFETAQDAGLTFVRVARVMLDAGEACADDRGETDPACEALFASAAFAQVAGVRVLECTHPGIFEARQAMRAHVRDVERVMEDGGTVDAPKLPSCE